MRRRWHSLWLVPLIFLLSGGVEWLSARPPKVEKEIMTSSAQVPKAPSPRIDRKQTRKAARLVPLYPAGSLYVKRPAPKPKSTKKKKRLKRAKRTKRQPAPRPEMHLDGKRPSLEVAYEGIGFERYLEVIERVGRFFVIIEDGEGVGLGPGVSLRDGITLRRSADDLADLAAKRPHLVSDLRIRQRLDVVELPLYAARDRVVLLLTKPFDSMLWDAVAKTVSKHGVRLDEIARIIGAYEEGSKGVFLRLDAAALRKDGREIPLGRKIRVSL